MVPFRPAAAVEPKPAPSLTPIERRAFRELAQELTSRLRGAHAAITAEAVAQELAANHDQALTRDELRQVLSQALNQENGEAYDREPREESSPELSEEPSQEPNQEPSQEPHQEPQHEAVENSAEHQAEQTESAADEETRVGSEEQSQDRTEASSEEIEASSEEINDATSGQRLDPAKPAAEPGAGSHQQHRFLLLAILAKRNHTRVARSPSGISNI